MTRIAAALFAWDAVETEQLAIMMAMALVHVKAGRIEQMRSLVRPIRQTG